MPEDDQPMRNKGIPHGYIIGGDVYPYDEGHVEFHLMYCEDEDAVMNHKATFKRFVVRKNDAQTIAKQIIDILAAPDTETAWEHVLKNIPEAHEPDWAAEGFGEDEKT
jgi:hypothetical protein